VIAWCQARCRDVYRQVYFQATRDYVLQLIADGLAGMDDTLQEQTKQERGEGVLVLITHQDWHILSTRRSKQLESHPGEVCLPGGKQNPGGHQDDLVTALRETIDYCVGLKNSPEPTIADEVVSS
jgi:hypothetical protein